MATRPLLEISKTGSYDDVFEGKMEKQCLYSSGGFSKE